jgi:glycosyltransferase involved in cell wall biosynthesis
MSTRLLYLVSHPIQYQAPLLRHIAAAPAIRLRVVFLADTADGYFDAGFGRQVRWDVPLRQGYDSVVLGETDLETEIAAADAVWLHGWQGPVMRRALRLAARLGKPVLMRGENTNVAMPDGALARGWLKRRFLAGVFGGVAAFLAIGSANRAYYRRRGVAEERLFAMPYAVDNESFAAAAAAARPQRAALRHRLGLDERPVILYCGKLIARKHPELLLAAWHAAAWPGQRPQLLFVGDGEMAGRLQAADSGARFAGFRNQRELPALYDLADVFVLPSEREPWGLAVNEAMACGTAVVVSDQCGCAADLVDPACGAVVPCNRADALAAALVEVVARAEPAGRAAAARIAGWDFAADLAGLEAALAWIATGAWRRP